MRIGVQTSGTDGDILPFISLAQRLVRMGHEATLVISSFEGKEYALPAGSPQFSIVHTSCSFKGKPTFFDMVGRVLIMERDPWKQLRSLMNMPSHLAEQCDAAQELCRHCDVVVAHAAGYFLQCIAAQRQVPCVSLSITAYPLGSSMPHEPAIPFSWELPANLVPDRWKRCLQESGWTERPTAAPLAPKSDRLHLVGASPVFRLSATDAGTSDPMCGFLETSGTCGAWERSPALETFLADGEPPVYITFGSVMPRDPTFRRQVTNLIVEAVTLVGCRAIIQVAADDRHQRRSDRRILFNPPTLYRDVFPRCRAVVHHGSAGTTHVTTRAGCPSVVVFSLFDQLFWGKQLLRLNVAPLPLHAMDMTAKTLAERIRAAVTSTHMRREAQRLAGVMQGEDGVTEVVRRIDTWRGA